MPATSAGMTWRDLSYIRSMNPATTTGTRRPNIEARDRSAQLTVRFVSQMISVTRDKIGAIVDGNPDKVADITDVWTFARDTTSRDPNWKLVGTGSGH